MATREISLRDIFILFCKYVLFANLDSQNTYANFDIFDQSLKEIL